MYFLGVDQLYFQQRYFKNSDNSLWKLTISKTINGELLNLSKRSILLSSTKLKIINSRAPAARRAAKLSPIIIEKGTTRMHRNRNPCNSFLMVKMASGMDHGRARPTTTTTNDDDDERRRRRRTTTTTTNDVAQHGGHLANTKSCRLGLQHISLILDMHTMFN